MRVHPLDAFFISTSAVCVTGLVTVTTATSWSLFGKCVIMLLIQIGGLSLTMFFMLVLVQLGRKVTLKNRLNLQASFNTNDISGIVRMLLLVIRGTLLVEGIGAVCLAFSFHQTGRDWAESAFFGVFHSVSAFCNAGFDLIGDEGFIPFSGMVFFNLVITSLIIMGGIGFTVWRDLYMKIQYRLSPSVKRKMRLSIHTKLALISTASLILFGTLFFFIYEYSNPETLGPMPVWQKQLAAFFQSVTLRTAGFATIAQGGLREASRLMSCVLMIIGGSPGGTAGGMKTVTFTVLILASWSMLRGDSHIKAFERSLSVQTLQKALTVAMAMLFLWFVCSVALSFTEMDSAFQHGTSDILFEVASALGTVGVSTGLTPYLSAAGKIVLIACMYIGRIGPLTLVVSAMRRSNHASEYIQYPNEDVLIG